MRCGELRPDAGAAGDGGLVAGGDGGGEAAGIEHGEDAERHLGAHALDGLEQAEPLALRVRPEAEQADHVLAHMGLDGENRRLAGGRQVLEGAGGAMDHVADAVHVEDHEILAVGIDHAFEFADHVRPLLPPCPPVGRVRGAGVSEPIACGTPTLTLPIRERETCASFYTRSRIGSRRPG